MREVLEQLFLYNQALKEDILDLEDEPKSELNQRVLEMRHVEWDRIKHLMDLCYKSLGV